MKLKIKETEQLKSIINAIISENKDISDAAKNDLSQQVSECVESFFPDLIPLINFFKSREVEHGDKKTIPSEWVRGVDAESLNGYNSNLPGLLSEKNTLKADEISVGTFIVSGSSCCPIEYFNGAKNLEILIIKALNEIIYKLNIQAFMPIFQYAIEGGQVLLSKEKGKLDKDSLNALCEEMGESEFSIFASPESKEILDGFRSDENSNLTEIFSINSFGLGNCHNHIFGALARQEVFTNQEGEKVSFDPETMDMIIGIKNSENNLFKILVNREGKLFYVEFSTTKEKVFLHINLMNGYLACAPIGAKAMVI